MDWSWRVGRLRGLEVRVHWTLGLLALYCLLRSSAVGGSAGMLRALVALGALFAVVLWHELGHAWAARRCRLRVGGVTLWALGGECQLASPVPTPRADLLVSLAGPAAHALLVAATFVPLRLLLPRLGPLDPFGASSELVAAWSMALWLLAFNLIPAFPLDGGRALRALLTFRLGELRATVVAVRIGQVFGGGLLVLGLARDAMIFAALGVFVIFACQQEYRMVMHAGQVYGGWGGLGYGRGDWRPGEPAGTGQRGFFRRLADRWRSRRARSASRRRDRLRAEVDRILDKVNRSGLPALSKRERRTLERASEDLRGRR